MSAKPQEKPQLPHKIRSEQQLEDRSCLGPKLQNIFFTTGSAGEFNHLARMDPCEISKIFARKSLCSLDKRLDSCWRLMCILGLGSEDDTSHRNPSSIGRIGSWSTICAGPGSTPGQIGC